MRRYCRAAQSSAPPDVLRAMLQQPLQDVITAEFSKEVGAAQYARSPERRDVRARSSEKNRR